MVTAQTKKFRIRAFLHAVYEFLALKWVDKLECFKWHWNKKCIENRAVLQGLDYLLMITISSPLWPAGNIRHTSPVIIIIHIYVASCPPRVDCWFSKQLVMLWSNMMRELINRLYVAYPREERERAMQFTAQHHTSHGSVRVL